MHLNSLTIKNFRILEDVTIEKLGHVNLIVGKNNSGKSTVLEALALLASGFDFDTVTKIQHYRTLKKYYENSFQDFSTGIKYSIETLLTNGKKSQNAFIGNNDYFINFGYVIPDSSKEFLGEHAYTGRDNNNFNFQISSNQALNPLKELTFGEKRNQQYNFSIIDTDKINIKDLAKIWDDAVLTEDEDLTIKMLKIINEDIVDFAFLSTDTQERIPFVRIDKIKSRVPLYDMGDGILRLLQIILKVLNARNGFLLIDEFENGLHYSVQPKVWELIFELAHRFNIQVFATTHSWDCIESFAQVAKDRTDMQGVLFRMGHSVRKSDNGKLIATVFDEDDLYNLTKMQMEVR